MFARHVTKELSAYCHQELTGAAARRVREHVLRCADCARALAEIKRGVSLANAIAPVPAPPELWREIEMALNVGKEARNNTDRATRFFFFARPRSLAPVFATALLLVLCCGGGIWLWHAARQEGKRAADAPLASPPAAAWSVTRLAGGASELFESSDDGRLSVGEALETGRDSRARLKVADIGRVELDPQTRVRLIETQADGHRLALDRGKIHALIFAPPRLFFVDTPSGVAVDYGCAYTLEVDDAGRSTLRVTAGRVALELNGRQAMVPARYLCETRPGVGPGTPYFDESSPSFRANLSKLDFERGGAAALKVVLAEARQSDALSLWYLLPRVAPAERAFVYERLFALVPPPRAAVTREGVLRLDEGMLDRWKNEIESR